MLYKLSSALFMITTVVFAGLYFAEKQNETSTLPIDAQVEKNNPKVVTKTGTKTVVEKVIVEKEKDPKVVFKRISSHPELTEGEIDMMLEIRDSMRRDYSRNLRREHPLMFERLELDEETEGDFLLLVGERRMALNMRADRDMSDEEREEYNARRDEILEVIDGKIADLVGPKFDSYVNYRERSQQYQSVASLNSRLKEAGTVLDVDQQDQLAQVLYDNRREAFEENKDFDWRVLRESPEKAEEMVNFHKERYEKMKEQANFLNEDQRVAFEKHLESSLSRYSRWAERIKNGGGFRR